MVRAIDSHVHPSTKEYLIDTKGPFTEATAKYFKTQIKVRTVDEMAQEFRDLDIKAVLLGWDDETATGQPPLSNDFVARCVREHPDVFVGFAGVDPWKGKVAIKELERSVKELGLIGAKFHQAAQQFFPDDNRFYPLWDKCQELGIPVLFHCGTTGLGGGTPGGMGIRLKYLRPICLDDVAADFPDLTIIAAHPAWPWTEEALAVALHKANVYIDLSGWSPKYFPAALVNDIKTRLQDKAMFGTDYPYITPQRWLSDFELLDITPEIRQKLLVDNAKRILKL